MLRDEGGVVESSWGAACERSEPHREIDRELRGIATRKSGLASEEARWLREAERYRIWRKLGFSTALEYLEDVFGYAPRTAKDRRRVAKALGELPALDAELRSGALPYSAARELTRVMTPATEAQWLAHARGKNVHDIRVLIAGHKRGDAPEDPKDPALMLRAVVFTLDPRRDALLQQARAMFEEERGEHLDDAALMEALCLRALAGADAQPCGTRNGDALRAAKAPRPMQQVVIRTCDDCRRTWQEGRGSLHEVTHSDFELCACDAEVVHEADVVAAQAAGKRRPAPTLTVPSKTRDLVWTRDCGRCRFPGCRATRHLAVHHIVHRSDGGDHDPSNLVLLCDGHHKLLHDGIVTITGRAPDQLVFTRDGKPLVDPRSPTQTQRSAKLRAAASATSAAGSRFDRAVTFEHAKQALLQLGFKAREAKRALEDACAHVGTDADVATLVKAALDRAAITNDDFDNPTLATRALVQSGFSRAVAERAVTAARAHVSTDAALATLIAEAFRRCRDL